MKRVLVLLVICALAAAFVPRNRRSLPDISDSTTASSAKPNRICAPQTPCAWAIYKPVSKIVETDLPNNYCRCASDMVCTLYEDDTTSLLYEYRCQPRVAQPS